MIVEAQGTSNGPRATIWAAITDIENASETIICILIHHEYFGKQWRRYVDEFSRFQATRYRCKTKADPYAPVQGHGEKGPSARPERY